MNISNSILKRKGATKLSLIPNEVLDLLNKGALESVNLTEWLAVDHSILSNQILPRSYADKCQLAINNLEKQTAMQSILAVSKSLYDQGVDKHSRLFDLLSTHISDSVRCWAAYLIGLDQTLSVKEKLESIKRFAADKHFGVREIAWMAVREDVTSNLEEAIHILTDWTLDLDPNIRRFASEVTRPRGVWCKHIDALKTHPEMAIGLIENLKADTDQYVKDSIGNWLNDASKTQPDFVQDLCHKWSTQEQSKDTLYIVKKALRTMNKK